MQEFDRHQSYANISRNALEQAYAVSSDRLPNGVSGPSAATNKDRRFQALKDAINGSNLKREIVLMQPPKGLSSSAISNRY
jgi:hypothetical protein